jgi:hypothetical protein
MAGRKFRIDLEKTLSDLFFIQSVFHPWLKNQKMFFTWSNFCFVVCCDSALVIFKILCFQAFVRFILSASAAPPWRPPPPP